MMNDRAATTLIDRPDGSQTLLLRQAHLTVIKGPDRGAELVLDRPSVQVGTGPECSLRLTDPAVSRCHLELRATDDGFLLRDLGSTNGTLLGEAYVREMLLAGPVTLKLGDSTLQVAPSPETIELEVSRRNRFGSLIGVSTPMRRTFALLEGVASTDATVLLEGQSGTGKELAAEAIHSASSQADGPFVVVDCTTIPKDLAESELFGHEQGSFTGATQARIGAFEQADGGTLLLDEVGDLPPQVQPRLLRFLETQQVKRVGASQRRHVNVRVIAATHRNLLEDVDQGRFRSDLYYRLAVVRIELPPLRDRPEDIPLLAHHFAEQFARDPRTLISEQIGALLASYHWPGNVRELRNTVERLAVIPKQALHSLKAQVGTAPPSSSSEAPGIGALANLPFHEARLEWQQVFERQYLAIQLQRADNVVAHAAERAGLPRQSFHRLLRRQGIRDA